MPITQVTQEERNGPTHIHPFSSLNLVFTLHQAVSNTVKIHYISPNWNEAAVFLQNIDTLRCIFDLRLQLPLVRRHNEAKSTAAKKKKKKRN